MPAAGTSLPQSLAFDFCSLELGAIVTCFTDISCSLRGLLLWIGVPSSPPGLIRFSFVFFFPSKNSFKELISYNHLGLRSLVGISCLFPPGFLVPGRFVCVGVAVIFVSFSGEFSPSSLDS